LFIVKDTGMGLTDEEQKNLFQKFQQVDGSISRRFGGSGLGLYISLNLAQLMGGKVTVSSEKLKGSEFTLSIPYQQSDLLVQQPKTEQKDIKEHFNGSILVAEDTLPIQIIVRRILENMGIEVTIAENGEEAVNLLEKQSFDLILMDMQMPVMDGIEATKIIKQREIQTPVYALTANVFDKVREKFELAGCSGFLSKPINKNELIAILSKHLTS